MSRYSLLRVYLIIFALFQNTIAAPEKGKGKESGSDGGNSGSSSRRGVSLSGVKDFAAKVGKELSSKLGLRNKSTWEDVTFLDEKGMLKVETGTRLWYCFYPYSELDEGWTTTGAEAKLCFQLEDMINASRDGRIVKFKLDEDSAELFTLMFANETDAFEFLGK